MFNIFLLDENLNRTQLIDNYKSLLWISRYNGIGDCEIVVPASTEMFSALINNKYIVKSDDDMVCRIEKIELNTDEEDGNSIIITGYDVRKILNQRIVWKQTNANGLVEDYLRRLVTENVVSPSDVNRKIDNFILGQKAGFTERFKEQITYDSLGNKIQETCATYGWGWKVTVEDDKFVFKIYKGEDKSKTVFFSDKYDNLATTQYSEDKTDIATIALVAGEGEGTNRITDATGTGSGMDRYEIYVDARDLSKKIDYEQLLENYPDGIEVTVDEVIYYRVSGKDIAVLTKNNADEVIGVELVDSVYKESLVNRGQEKLAEHYTTSSFVGTVISDFGFKYKTDYNLGDIVTVENEYGISVKVRITEIMEVNDSTGYRIEPTFEVQGSLDDLIIFLATESNDYLVTEDGLHLAVE